LVIGETKMPIEDKKQLVTSLRIDPEIWKEAKVAAIQNDMTLTNLVEEAIDCWIKMKAEKKK
jgi:predicted HicB family RNase H-like nuclease